MLVLHDLIRGSNNAEKLLKLLSAGLDPNARTAQGGTPLHLVASKKEIKPRDTKKCLQMASDLIASGADVNALTKYEITPLIFAVRAGKWRMVEFLLEANADINHIDKDGNTALHYAIINRDRFRKYDDVVKAMMKVVKTLLRFHPEMNVRNIWDRTPLIIAVIYHDFKVIQELLRHNASVNFLNSNLCSAMHYALSLSEVDVNIILELLRHGGDFCIRNWLGLTPLDVYINRLLHSSSGEAKKAKFVFKLYILGGNPISSSQQGLIDTISREKNCQLSQFLVHCLNESKKMRRDEIAPNYHMYNMALRGFSYRIDEGNHVPLNIFDKVLDKLLKGRYPVYCDLIVSGICRPYLSKKFAEMCSSVGNCGRAFLNSNTLFSLSFYLSHGDMFNMIVACSPFSRWVQILQRWHRYTNCPLL